MTTRILALFLLLTLGALGPAEAVLSSTTARAAYTADGIGATFIYPFRVLAASDLAVYVSVVLQGAGYTVTGVGAAGGGNVIFASPPVASAQVLILRNVAATQVLDLIEHGATSQEALESTYDRLVMMTQQDREQLGRAIKLPRTSLLVDVNVPTPAAGLCWAWNAGATALENIACGSTPSAAYALIAPSAALPTARTLAAGTNGSFFDSGPGGALTISATGGAGTG